MSHPGASSTLGSYRIVVVTDAGAVRPAVVVPGRAVQSGDDPRLDQRAGRDEDVCGPLDKITFASSL